MTASSGLESVLNKKDFFLAEAELPSLIVNISRWPGLVEYSQPSLITFKPLAEEAMATTA